MDSNVILLIYALQPKVKHKQFSCQPIFLNGKNKFANSSDFATESFYFQMFSRIPDFLHIS